MKRRIENTLLEWKNNNNAFCGTTENFVAQQLTALHKKLDYWTSGIVYELNT